MPLRTDADVDALDERSRRSIGTPSGWLDVGPAIDGGSFVVTWNVFDNDVTGFLGTREDTTALYRLEDRTARLIANASASTATHGVVALEDPANPTVEGSTFASGVWVTHERAEPRFLALEPGERPSHVLHPATVVPAARILVVDELRRPIAGVRVRQQALPADTEFPPREFAAIGRRALIRESVTGDDGAVARIPLGGAAWIRASHGNSLASVETDGGQTDITLVLQRSWTIRGRILGDIDVGPWATIVVDRVDAAEERRSITSSNLDERQWGPIAIPFDPDAVAYEFTLRFGETVPTLRRIDAPRPGDSVVVDFDPAVGTKVWVRALDAATEEPIGGALLDFRWRDVTSGRVLSLNARTSESGWAGVAGAPPAVDSWSVSAKGYGTHHEGWLDIGTAPRILTVQLSRAARIDGTIDLAGADLEDFVVKYGREGEWPLRHRVWFRDPTSAAFTIEDLQDGTYALHAVMGRRATSIERVRTEPDGASPVRLTLLPTASVRGKTIDAGSGRPVPDARIAVALGVEREQDASTLTRDWRTDARGDFELVDVPASGAVLWAEHENRAAFRMALGDLAPGEVRDLGLIPLRPRLAVRARLIGEVEDPTLYSASFTQSTVPMPFRRDGTAEVDGAVLGDVAVLHHPTGDRDLHAYAVRDEQIEEVRLHVWPGLVRAVFVDRDGRDATFDGDITFSWVDPAGVLVVRKRQGLGAHTIEMPGVPRGEVHYSAWSVEGRRVGAGTAAYVGDGTLKIELRDTDTLLRVVEMDGRPATGALVHLDRVVAGMTAFQQAAYIDEDGRAPFIRPTGGEFYVGLQTTDGRRIVARRVQLRQDGETDVIVDATHALDLRITVDGAAAANAPYALRPPYAPRLVRAGSTGLGGEIRLDRIGPDGVLLEVALPGRWPVSRLVSPSSSTEVIEAPRRANIALRVTDDAGAAVAGAAVGLVHTNVRHFDLARGELGGDVAAWMEAGLVPKSSLLTDFGGRLVVAGVPAGVYAVEVRLGERWVEGSVQFGGGAAEATLVLP